MVFKCNNTNKTLVWGKPIIILTYFEHFLWWGDTCAVKYTGPTLLPHSDRALYLQIHWISASSVPTNKCKIYSLYKLYIQQHKTIRYICMGRHTPIILTLTYTWLANKLSKCNHMFSNNIYVLIWIYSKTSNSLLRVLSNYNNECHQLERTCSILWPLKNDAGCSWEEMKYDSW